MTRPMDEHGEQSERLRRVLQAEVDSVKGSHDALERIRARTERQTPAWLPLIPWLRPALAACGAAFIAGSVVVSTPGLREIAWETFNAEPPGAASTDPVVEPEETVALPAPPSSPSGPAEEPTAEPSPPAPEDSASAPGGMTMLGCRTEAPDPQPSTSGQVTTQQDRRTPEDCSPTPEPEPSTETPPSSPPPQQPTDEPTGEPGGDVPPGVDLGQEAPGGSGASEQSAVTEVTR
ncbi:hypothetical protein [Allonocardiopsis opalescens]|uniref:Uncharacterized protein n=1 Tax=Allonocardiopsis opalescens TaxID=1144618 RepID=A0A2T0QFN2_9ACTN|nr:hypothetical protein [Allonocardiopsis opalescens]PRY02690.1 hypothetical protein CLV72_1011293 [Allonocardiopsis opalescens]